MNINTQNIPNEITDLQKLAFESACRLMRDNFDTCIIGYTTNGGSFSSYNDNAGSADSIKKLSDVISTMAKNIENEPN